MRRYKNGRLQLAHPDKFFTHVDITLQDCWEWRGAHNKKGYGGVWVDGRHRLTHRHAWILTHGAIPDGLFVCHSCDNPRCINPDHLFLGDNSANMLDMVRKERRSFRGEQNPGAKLTDAQAQEIRQRYRYGLGSILAKEYGVSLHTVMYHAYKKQRGNRVNCPVAA